ncbi:MAG: hypothetical protein M1820_007314 [Bogoriella megaspora]|nr:MAG: hypothetical protein M1820_007314 [Bogoriella megaspora]
MVHLSTPQPDTGHFTTLSVRPSTKPSSTVSRTIRFPSNHYTRSPNLAAGFSALDLSSSSSAVRANLVGANITKKTFKILVETWGDSTLHRADATWIEHAKGARECQFGQFDTRDAEEGDAEHEARGGTKDGSGEREGKGRRELPQEHSLYIEFPHPFKEQPTVIVWLNRLDLKSGEEHNYRINASATNVTTKGFMAHLDTWGDGVMNGAAMAWIAFPSEKRRVASGVVKTADVRSWGNPKEKTSGWVQFPGRLFPPPRRKSGEKGVGGEDKENLGEDKENLGEVNGQTSGEVDGKEKEKEQKPTVLIALKMLDMAGNADLRIKTHATDVTREGFRWHLDTWDDSTLYAAEASWIALGFA